MTLRDILQQKGTEVFTTVAKATIKNVIRAMVEHNCGSLVVCSENDAQKMIGIVTERDILRALASGKEDLQSLAVSEVMTARVITGRIDSQVQDIMGLMTDHRIRHLPIVEDGRLVGLISIGDVVKAQHDDLTTENHYLKEYLHG